MTDNSHIFAKLGKYELLGNVALGIFLSGLLVGISKELTLEALGGLPSASPEQVAIQIGLALFMFGFYLGTSIKTKSAVSEVLAGFIVGALLFPMALFGFSGNFSPAPELIMICAIPAGVLLSVQRTVFERKRLESAVKFFFNGFLWSVQTTATIGTIPEVSGLGPIVLIPFFAVILVALGFVQRTDLKIIFEIDSENRGWS